MTSLKIAFCTTCMNRLSHLKKTLVANLEDNRHYSNLVFVVLDYGDQQGVSNWIKSSLEEPLKRGRIALYRNPKPMYFHMAHAKNMVHRCGLLENADLLINIDADNFTGENFAGYINHHFQTIQQTYMRTGVATKPRSRGLGGRIALMGDDFKQIGGYDEYYETWGADDRNLAKRLAQSGLTQTDIDDKYLLRIEHSDELRVANYDDSFTSEHISQIYIRRNRSSIEKPIENDANRIDGLFYSGCGTVYRNFDEKPLEIEPFEPTQRLDMAMLKLAP